MSVQNFNLDIDDYTIAAGGYLELGKPADFFQIMQATGPVDITFLHSESSVGKAKGVGQGFRLGPLSNRFYGVKIYSATAQTLKLCFSSGKSPVDLSQVVSVTGTVSVVNGELSRVAAGSAFGGVGYQGAVAGQYSHCQLLNPAGSVKNIYLTGVSAHCLTSGADFSFGQYTTPLTALYGTGANKLLGSPIASVSEIRSQASATLLGSSVMGNIGTPSANAMERIPFSEPMIIPPGQGFYVRTNSVNLSFATTFQWWEAAI